MRWLMPTKPPGIAPPGDLLRKLHKLRRRLSKDKDKLAQNAPKSEISENRVMGPGRLEGSAITEREREVYRLGIPFFRAIPNRNFFAFPQHLWHKIRADMLLYVRRRSVYKEVGTALLYPPQDPPPSALTHSLLSPLPQVTPPSTPSHFASLDPACGRPGPSDRSARSLPLPRSKQVFQATVTVTVATVTDRHVARPTVIVGLRETREIWRVRTVSLTFS